MNPIFKEKRIKFPTQEIQHSAAVRIASHTITATYPRGFNDDMAMYAMHLDNGGLLLVKYNATTNSFTCSYTSIYDSMAIAAVVPFRLSRDIAFILAEMGLYHDYL